MGRRKIKLEEVEDTNTKQVTFSKRRLGLFKKASELATLCNAEVGIVVFSPGNKPYPFGRPDFNLIAERFKNEDKGSDSSETETETETEAETSSDGYNRRNQARQEKMIGKSLNAINEKLETEKKRGDDLQKWLECGEDVRFDKPIDELSLEELKEFEDRMKEVRIGIESYIDDMKASSSLLFLSKDDGNNK